MAEKKKIEKPKAQKKEKKVEPKVEQPKVTTAPAKRQPTLKEKIDRTVEDYKDAPEELKKQLFGLVQRVLYPDQFCPECNDRLFLSGQFYNCTNCGYQRAVNISAPTANTTPGTRPSDVSAVPKEVDAMIKQSNEDMKNVPRRGGTTKLGAKIQKLVSERDAGGPQLITPQDEAAVRRDGNVSNKINWV